MTTPKNWTPPTEMPADLPPLPMGKNGKPLVYLGKGTEFKVIKPGFWSYFLGVNNDWDYDNWNGLSKDRHYAAESDSEICRLNQWGDFDPRTKAVEPAKPQTTIAAYLASAEAAIQEADAAFQAATETAAEWAKELQARRDILDRLQGDNAFARRAWYLAGIRDERHHAKQRTTFPALPD